MKLLNVADYRSKAKRRLPRGLFEYIDRGTEDEVLMREIRAVLNAVKLSPRVLNDVSNPDVSVTVFGERLAIPTIIAPTALAGLVWHDGEVHLARAAGTVGVPYCIPTQSITSMEEIADRAKGTNLWFQLYMFEDRSISYDLMKRARDIGVKNILLTVDTARSPKKEWNIRNGFGMPIKPTVPGVLDVFRHPGWSAGVLLKYIRNGGLPTYAHHPPELRTNITQSSLSENVRLARRLTWEDVTEVRRRWDGNLVVKGIMARPDASRSLSLGANGIVVSCHGGRNLDSAPVAIDVLPEIVDAVGKGLTVLADSGIRRGSDILKYKAAGAEAVLIGRATLYGMAAAGEKGAVAVLNILRDELDHCMAFTGLPDLKDLSEVLEHFPSQVARE